MKTLEMKNIAMDQVNQGGTIGSLQYKELCETALRNPPKDGFRDIEEMRQRIKILDKLGTANGSLELEDAEAKVLRACVELMSWRVLDSSIIQFVDDVKGL